MFSCRSVSWNILFKNLNVKRQVHGKFYLQLLLSTYASECNIPLTIDTHLNFKTWPLSLEVLRTTCTMTQKVIKQNIIPPSETNVRNKPNFPSKIQYFSFTLLKLFPSINFPSFPKGRTASVPHEWRCAHLEGKLEVFPVCHAHPYLGPPWTFNNILERFSGELMGDNYLSHFWASSLAARGLTWREHPLLL